MKKKIVKKKAADKKKDNNNKKINKFKSDVTMIHHHYAFNSTLNTNTLSETFKKITDLMPFVKTLIDSKATVNKIIIPFSLWKIIVDFEAINHIFFNRNFIFDFKPISFYVKTESGELLQCSDCSKIKINLENLNSNIDVMMKNIIWCPDLNHNLFSTIPLN